MATATNRRSKAQLELVVTHYMAAGNAGHPAAQAAIAQLNARAWAAETARLDKMLAKGAVAVTKAGVMHALVNPTPAPAKRKAKK
jgi:hypothetical protein